jgi:predicted kinase
MRKRAGRLQPVSEDIRAVVALRGNSGSGKSTVAGLLRSRVQHQMALVEQDYLRRVVLRQKGNQGAAAKALIRQTALLALDHDYDVVLDGILDMDNYGELLRELATRESCVLHVYWFDVPFEETLRRHNMKPNADAFGEAEMREWWRDQDLSGLEGERLIPAHFAADEAVDRILADTGL